MNLHLIVSGAIGAVNPQSSATFQASTGSTTNDDGTRVPTYAAPVTIQCQIQSLQYNDLMKLSGLNIQGVRSKIYVNGSWSGLVRPEGKGGDLITFADGSVWLVAVVLEDWPDWCSVAVTRQVP
jgi:hypothetical protein